MNNDQYFAHWHDSIEFLFCKDGTGKITYENDVIELNPNDTVIINSNCIHTLNHSENARYFCLIVYKSFFDDYGIDIDSLYFKKHIKDSVASQLMEEVYKFYYKENDANDNLLTAKKANAILSYVLHMCQNHFDEKPIESYHNSKAHKAVLEAINYINKNFTSKLSIEEIAKKVNYSKYHFSRIFKDSTSITIIEYINNMRVECARRLLLESDKPATAIYEESGFTSYSFFLKIFKRNFGILPDEYRKKNICETKYKNL